MRERFLRTGPRGLALCLCEWGEGRPVIVLHGFLEQGAAWDAVARRLPRRVIAPDHRGHGRSGHVGAGGFYHFWDYVPDVDAVVDDVSDGAGPVDLVGHSMGGTLACLYAATRPAKVRRLVLVEGLGPPDAVMQRYDRPRQFVDAQRDPPVHRPLASLEDAALRIRRWTPSMSEETALRLAERASVPAPEHGERARVWRWDPLHRARNPIAFDAALFGGFLDRITAPTLCVQGATSPAVPPDLDARAARIANLERLVLPGGHMLHHDGPDALASAIDAFLG